MSKDIKYVSLKGVKNKSVEDDKVILEKGVKKVYLSKKKLEDTEKMGKDTNKKVKVSEKKINGKTLVVVESPGKISKIQSYLGPNYIVKASFGHILQVNPKGMNIDFTTFEPNYIQCSDKKSVISTLVSEFKKCSDLLIATDLDREGEMIAWSISYVLKHKNSKRIIFNDITRDSIIKAVENPKTIDECMVRAQKCRAVLDKVIGYDLSGLLRNNIGNAKSAGRVQSVVVRLIIDKENEIKNVDLSSYFKTIGNFENDISGTLNDNNKTMKITKFTYNEASNFIKNLNTYIFTINNIKTSEKNVKPQPPFTTATLQQEASTKHGLTPKSTMSIAQKLYENGFITYMRTDSVHLSDEALNNIKGFILSNFGDKYYKFTQYQTKGNAQEAHEAIRVTNVNLQNLDEENNFSEFDNKLYKLIWKRTIASQMTNAVYDVLKIIIDINKMKDKVFLSQTETLKFDGFLKVYGKDTVIENTINNIPKIGDIIKINKCISEETYNEIPNRYNEASLINKLDVKNLNIGRPSTYASIIDKITSRGYVEIADIEGVSKEVKSIIWNKNKIEESVKKINVGKEKKKFIPTELGITVTQYLLSTFPNIIEYKFTSDMENILDKIAEDIKFDWFNYMKNFYDDFKVNINKHKNIVQKDTTGDLLGEDKEYKYYKVISRFGAAIKKVDNNDKITYSSIIAPYTFKNITFEQAKEISKYPYCIGQYDNENIMIKNNNGSLYFTWKLINYSLINEDLNECIDIIKSNLDNTFKDDKCIYIIKNGQYGKYIFKQNISDKKSTNVKIPEIYLNTKLNLDLIKQICNSIKPTKKVVKKKVIKKKLK